MNKVRAKAVFVLSCLLALAANCYAQQVADTALTAQMLSAITTKFYDNIGQQARLYNGPEYDDPNPRIKGNPFYNDFDQFSVGEVWYDGLNYKNIPLLYDINRDLVVVLLPNKVSKMYLLKPRVGAFTLQAHHFVNVKTDTLSKAGNISPGIYDQLYKGQSEVLVSRRKDILERTNSNNTLENYYKLNIDYYIKKGNIYTSVSSLGNVLKVFADKRKELEQYVKTQKIKYKNNPEEAMVLIASYYDQISK